VHSLAFAPPRVERDDPGDWPAADLWPGWTDSFRLELGGSAIDADEFTAEDRAVFRSWLLGEPA
jgi:hypothetical protein